MKTLIVDDEPLAQKIIKNYCKNISSLEIVATCSNALQAHEILRSNHIDLIFLDINMPQINGLKFLETLNDPPLVVITTAYSEYALKSYELDVVDYLKKPFSFERFFKAIMKVEKRIAPPQTDSFLSNQPLLNKEEDKFVFIKANKKTVKIDFKKILFVEALGDYIKIHTNEGHWVTNLSMKKMEALLPNQQFPRIHKSYIIALKHLRCIEGNMVEIAEKKLPIGNSYRQEFFKLVQSFSGN
ncbi:response regulator transcription factor [Puteibacter caeruleilacunae]|nr:response regulator transcription factor [Puteibacter caeruleilacunae]